LKGCRNIKRDGPGDFGVDGSRKDEMTLEIPLAPEEESRLRERAAAAGTDVQTFVREAVFEKLERSTFAELLAPVHEATRRSGLSVDEIDAMADRAREEYWADRGGPHTPQP
jgi:hypothetical protein